MVPDTLPEDALAAGKLEEQLRTATELLDGFVSAQPNSPQKADALLRLGLCQQRLQQSSLNRPTRPRPWPARARRMSISEAPLNQHPAVHKPFSREQKSLPPRETSTER